MTQPLLEISDLSLRYPRQESHAIDHLGFDIQQGRSVGLVGASGAGKSSVARAIMQLARPEGGDIRFRGRSIFSMDATQMQDYRRNVQMVFQEPSASLSPRRSIGATLLEPLQHFSIGTADTQKARISSTLKTVGLDDDVLQRYPHQFSTGQQQRIAIARALVTDPALLIADEAVSSLDVSVQAQILELLQSLQTEYGITLMFISHDLAVVNQLADEVIVMYRGQLVEQCPARQFFTAPAHPYSRALLSFAQVDAPSTPVETQWRLQAGGNNRDRPARCLFTEHCGESMEKCSHTEPRLWTLSGENSNTNGPHCVKCHLYADSET